MVIVVGETGCGKTTQRKDGVIMFGSLVVTDQPPVPQFLLDHLITSEKGDVANIVVTQPRRVSALGVSARVSAERSEDGSVGYAIRGDSNTTGKTKLLFVTTGVALRRLAMDESRMLTGVTHVIVDEVRRPHLPLEAFANLHPGARAKCG